MCARGRGESAGLSLITGEVAAGELLHLPAGEAMVKGGQGRFEHRTRMSVAVGKGDLAEKMIWRRK